MTKTKSHTIAIYSRVSTDSQTTENQERELREIATRMGWSIMKVYRDLSPKRHPGDTLAGILRLGPPLGLLAALLRVGMAAGPRGADWDLPPPCRDRCDDPDWTKRAAPCAGPGIAQNAPSAHSFRAPFGVPDLYHMAKPRRVAIPVAEDRRLHAVLNGKNGTASARTVQLSKISPMPIGPKGEKRPADVLGERPFKPFH
jgi:hypothetical protein